MELKAVLLALTSLPLIRGETVLGVYIFHRHGDRTPKVLAPANLTALGADEVYSAGNFFRSRYIDSNATRPIFGISSDTAVLSQMSITSPVDNVLQSSAQGFTQGLYPPTGSGGAQLLANGSSVEAPFSGYQYIPINAVTSATSTTNAESSGWLQGSSGCGNAVISSNNYLSSDEYLTTYNQSQQFYQNLLPVINSTFTSKQANFKNGYTIYDYVHVATIHNSTIPSSDLLTTDTLNELFWLANAHEWNLAYNSSEPIRAVAGSVLAAQIVQQLNSTLSSNGATKLGVQFGAYGTFMSLFGLANLQSVSENFTGIVDYASAMVFELVTNATVSKGAYPAASDVSVRFLFANGTAAENELNEFPLFGQNETVLPWNTFTSEMAKISIGDTASWCTACGNTTGVCASTSSASSDGSGGSASSSSSSDNGVSRPVAGVIGALVTLAVILGLEALIYLAAGLRLVKKSTLAAAQGGATTTASSKA